jgi:hypothetical protein
MPMLIGPGSGVVACQPFERRKFLAGGVEIDLESLDFTG